MHFIHKSADARHAALQTIRAAFEYQGKGCFRCKAGPRFHSHELGQKCSACSRVYLADNLWPSFKDNLISEYKKVKVGSVEGTQSDSLRRETCLNERV
jgi:1-pyrroline-5-carboxylate dehydrogenase